MLDNCFQLLESKMDPVETPDLIGTRAELIHLFLQQQTAYKYD